MMFNDFMMRLPHDICFRIADYLYFEDLLRVRLVSRSWYRAFCKTDICAHAIQKQTSLPLKQFFQRFGVNYAELDDKMKDDCHRKYMINRIRREHGIASSIFELEYDFINKAPKFHYSDGRVMIGFSDNIIVEDLKTRKKSIFQYPPNTIPIYTEFSGLVGQYVLSKFKYYGIYGSSEKHDQLVIWNVISRRMLLFPMPLAILTAASFQNQVGLVLTNAKEFGKNLYFLILVEENGFKKLVTLIENQHPKLRIVKARLFFHPSEKGVVFITIQTRMLSMFDSSNYGTRITVYCYEDYKLVSTQQEIIKTKTLPAEDKIEKYSDGNQICFYAREPPFGWIPRSLKSCNFAHRIIVTNQGPESRWFPVQVYDNGIPLDQKRLQAEFQSSGYRRVSYTRWIKQDFGYLPLLQYGNMSDKTFYEHLIYDMNTRQFTQFKIPLHLTYQECLFGHHSLIWNDQVFIRARHENVEKLQVITLSKELSGLWNGSVGKDDSSLSRGSSITRGENRSSCQSSPNEFQHGFQDGFQDELQGEDQENPDIKVYGDDNYVVLKSGKTVKVWRF
ncbi:hypothetical protein EPUL_005440, partial [Erysiphe pulchra]